MAAAVKNNVTCEQILSRFSKNHDEALDQSLHDLQEALQILKAFWTQHNFLQLSFERFQCKLDSHLFAMKLFTGKNKPATSDTDEILLDICCIVETAMIDDTFVRMFAVQLCRNTLPQQLILHHTPLIFTCTKRMQCMAEIVDNEYTADTVNEDLEDIQQSAIIDSLELDDEQHKVQWQAQLLQALQEAQTTMNKPRNNQRTKPTFNDSQNAASDLNDDDDMKYITPTNTISDPSLNEPYLIPYSLEDCKLIVGALLNVIMQNPADLDIDSSSPSGSNCSSSSSRSNTSSTNSNSKSRLRFRMRFKRKKKTKSDAQQHTQNARQPMDYQLIMGQLKDVLVQLSHECSFNQLLRICDLIARYQLTFFLKYKRMDSQLVELIQDFLVNKGRIKIENIQVLAAQGVLFTRMLPFRPFLARLATYPTLPESPKLLQLLLALMCYRGEQDIINAYKSYIDYEQQHAICIDTVAIYLPKMMDIICNRLYRLRRKGELELIDIAQKHYADPEYNKTDAIYNRVFGRIPDLIRRFGKGRFLIRVFVLLGKDKNQGPLYEYPRTLISIESLDDKVRPRIEQQVYAKLVDIKQPVHVYQVLLAKKRHECDIHLLQYELMQYLQRKKSDVADEEEAQSDENAVNSLLATHCSLFVSIVYPQRYKNGKLVFTKKSYHLYANSIMRFDAEKDILTVLPRYFAENQLTNVLQETQMQQIESYRLSMKDRYSKDVQFKEYQRQFLQYKKSRKSTASTK